MFAGRSKKMVVCIRGAITAQNTEIDMLEKTREMLTEIIERNSLEIDDIISITFTATKDLDKVYPAVVARKMGITDAALMCVQEMYVEGSMVKCIRVALLAQSHKKQKDVSHVYLGGAKVLRPDIAKREEK